MHRLCHSDAINESIKTPGMMEMGGMVGQSGAGKYGGTEWDWVGWWSRVGVGGMVGQRTTGWYGGTEWDRGDGGAEWGWVIWWGRVGQGGMVGQSGGGWDDGT